MSQTEKALITKKATREAFGDEIVQLGKENKNIYVIDIDIGKSCKTGEFIKQLPPSACERRDCGTERRRPGSRFGDNR